MKDKSPAFRFYPDSWLSSTDIQLMTPAEEGAYFRLLCHSWLSEDCGLPNDDAALAKLSRLGTSQWKKSGACIRRKFEERDGRLFNQRLIEERKKQIEWSDKCSVAGKRSVATKAATKAQPKINGSCDLVEVYLQPKVNSSFSSSFSSSVVTKTVTTNPINPLVQKPVARDPIKALGWERPGWKWVAHASDVVCDAIRKLKDRDFERSDDLDSPYMIWGRLDWFEEFWMNYWLHKNKKKARAVYFAAIRTSEMHERVIEAVVAQSPEMLARPEAKRPHATTWLNGEEWNDAVQRMLEAGAGGE